MVKDEQKINQNNSTAERRKNTAEQSQEHTGTKSRTRQEQRINQTNRDMVHHIVLPPPRTKQAFCESPRSHSPPLPVQYKLHGTSRGVLGGHYSCSSPRQTRKREHLAMNKMTDKKKSKYFDASVPDEETCR